MVKLCSFGLSAVRLIEDSHVSAGLFCAAVEFRWTDGLPHYEFEALSELGDWFNTHLKSPFDYLPASSSAMKEGSPGSRRLLTSI